MDLAHLRSPTSFDLVIVLGAQLIRDPINRDVFRPAAHTEQRVVAAGVAYLRGIAPRFLISGGYNFGVRYSVEEGIIASSVRNFSQCARAQYNSLPSEARLIATNLHNRFGVPFESMLLEESAADTEENAAFIKVILRRQWTDVLDSKQLSIGILTSASHMDRAISVFLAAGIPICGRLVAENLVPLAPKLIESAQLRSVLRVHHGFFARCGGFSTGEFSSLNVACQQGEDQASVARNRALVACMLSARTLLIPDEVHGRDVWVVTELTGQQRVPQADAVVTTLRSVAVGVMTADCVPVLFAASNSCVIGAAHAGWKGALAGVVQSTVSELRKLTPPLTRLIAAVGPCIQQRSYEVGQDVYQKFVDSTVQNQAFFAPSNREGHYMFDLSGYVRGQLLKCCVEVVDTFANDTYSEPSNFYSFRRATHLKESKWGKHVAAIALCSSCNA